MVGGSLINAGWGEGMGLAETWLKGVLETNSPQLGQKRAFASSGLLHLVQFTGNPLLLN